jgi:hypothetical protein
LSYSIARFSVTSQPGFSAGQQYVGAHLNVYKPGCGVLLSSLERFNGGFAGYQQLPWIANINGVALWTQTTGDNQIGGFSILHTHQPTVSQREGVLIAAYSIPRELNTILMSSLFHKNIRLLFPSPACFDEARYIKKKFLVNFDLQLYLNSLKHDKTGMNGISSKPYQEISLLSKST